MAFTDYVKVDVMIDGTGFTGLLISLHLAKTGLSVVVLKVNEFGREASRRS